MVSKFDNVRPKLYFTPLMVINFRNKTPVLQFRVMNSQGTLLDVENLTAQWAKPTRSEEGETFGKLYDVKMTAFQMIKSPISISHTIDKDSPFFGQKLQKLKGTLFVSIVVWDPIVQRAVRAMTYYSLAKDVKYNHRFDDITVKSSTQARIDGGNPTSDATRFNNVVSIDEILTKKKSREKTSRPSSKYPSKSVTSHESIAAEKKYAESNGQGSSSQQQLDHHLETNHYRRKRESGSTNQKSKLPWKVQREQPGMMRGFSQFNDSTSHEFNNNSLIVSKST